MNKKKLYGTLLIEIGTEELPLNNLKNLGKSFVKYLSYLLVKNNFYYKKIDYFISLTRISCLIYNISFYQIIFIKNLKYKKIYGPFINLKKNILYYKNSYIKVLDWLYNNKKTVDELIFKDKKNIRFFYYKQKLVFSNIEKFLQDNLFNVLNKLKRNVSFMRWGINNFSFIRPINNIVILFNKRVICVKIFGIKSSNKLISHRCLNYKKIIIKNANNYINILKNICLIIVNYKQRKNIILFKINKILLKYKLIIKISNIFLNKIISLVEYPNILIYKFNIKFIYLPYKVIINILNNFNCIHTYSVDKKLLTNYYILVLDLDVSKKNKKNILLYYNHIIESKLNDSFFLFYKDRKYSLISYFSKLKNIVLIDKKDNLVNKITRLLFFTKYIVCYLNLKLNLIYLSTSIILCKCDLVTNLFKEFKNLKGFISMYYAKLDNYSLYIVDIIKYHYFPNDINNNVSKNLYSSIISLSDKLDTLISISLIDYGFYLKKSNDIYGLRKLSFYIIKIILFYKFDINLLILIKYLLSLFKLNININKCSILVINYIFKRVINYFILLGYKKELVLSVYNKNNNFNVNEIKNKIDFIIFYIKNYLYDFKYILFVYKRLKNILKNINFNNLIIIKMLNIDINFIYEFKYFKIYHKKFIFKKDYLSLFNNYLNFSYKIDFYLNNTKIYILDINIRNYRISLLYKIYLYFTKFMDFSYFFKNFI